MKAVYVSTKKTQFDFTWLAMRLFEVFQYIKWPCPLLLHNSSLELANKSVVHTWTEWNVVFKQLVPHIKVTSLARCKLKKKTILH